MYENLKNNYNPSLLVLLKTSFFLIINNIHNIYKATCKNIKAAFGTHEITTFVSFEIILAYVYFFFLFNLRDEQNEKY